MRRTTARAPSSAGGPTLAASSQVSLFFTSTLARYTPVNGGPGLPRALRAGARLGAGGRTLGAARDPRAAPRPEALHRPGHGLAAHPEQRPLGAAEGARAGGHRGPPRVTAAVRRGRVRAHRPRA